MKAQYHEANAPARTISAMAVTKNNPIIKNVTSLLYIGPKRCNTTRLTPEKAEDVVNVDDGNIGISAVFKELAVSARTYESAYLVESKGDASSL